VDRDPIRPWLWPISLGLLAGLAATLAAGRLDWEYLDSLPRDRFPRLFEVVVCFASGILGVAILGFALRPRRDRLRAGLLVAGGLAYLLAIFAASILQISHRQALDDRLILLSLATLVAGQAVQIAFHAALGAALARAIHPVDDRARRIAETGGVVVVVATLVSAGVWAFHFSGDPPKSIGVAASRGAAGLAAIATLAAGLAAVRIARSGLPPDRRPRRVAGLLLVALAITAAADAAGIFILYWDHVRPGAGQGIVATLVETRLFSMPARYLPGLAFALGTAETLRLTFDRRTA
jgi:hypothetical protein